MEWFQRLLISMGICVTIAQGAVAEDSGALAPSSSPFQSAEPTVFQAFEKTITRDFSLRQLGHLRISNPRGKVSVRGWTQDRVRVIAIQKVSAQDSQEADSKFKAMDLTLSSVDSDIELKADYGQGRTLAERLKEKRIEEEYGTESGVANGVSQLSRMDIEVRAPYKLKLSIVSKLGNIDVSEWRASLDVRTGANRVSISEVSASEVTVHCPRCEVYAQKVNAAMRIVAGNQRVTLREAKIRDGYFETGGGSFFLEQVAGQFLLVTRSGDIEVKHATGKVEFQSETGQVKVERLKGFLSGKTQSGAIRSEILEWQSKGEKAFIDSVDGPIEMALPRTYLGELDLSSGVGKISVQLPFFSKEKKASRQRVKGRIGDAPELIKVTSSKAEVKIKKTESF